MNERTVMAATAAFVFFGLMLPVGQAKNVSKAVSVPTRTMDCQPEWQSPLLGKPTKFGTATDLYTTQTMWNGD